MMEKASFINIEKVYENVMKRTSFEISEGGEENQVTMQATKSARSIGQKPDPEVLELQANQVFPKDSQKRHE